MGKLDGKVALVTGAGRGIGRGIALAMAKEGAKVAVIEKNPKTSASTEKEIRGFGGDALTVVCNVRYRKEVDAAVETIVNHFGTVDILVNNAQANKSGVPFTEVTDEHMAMVMESGFYGTFYFMQACFPYLKEHGGKIINVGSMAGLEGIAGDTAYAATKEAIRAITRVAAHEWGKYGINVNAFCPFANSPAVEGYQKAFPELFKELIAKIPLGRVGDCERDMGRACVFLASSDSDYITGQTIMLDGGQYMLR